MLRDLPAPVAADGQVVVEVKASAINFLEVLIRRGLLPADAGAAVGSRRRDRRHDGRRPPGARPRSLGRRRVRRGRGPRRAVALRPARGGVVRGGRRVPDGVPDGLDPAHATGRDPTRLAGARPRRGGRGRSAAVVVARELGAEVVATAGSAEKLDAPLSLGAAQAVTYDRLAEIEPVDVVFDPVGGQLFADSIGLLRPLGVAVAIGFAGGPWPPLDPALLVGRNVGVQGFYLGRLMQRRPDVVREAALDLLRLWRAGHVRPIVGATFPLAERPRRTDSSRTDARPARSCSSREGDRHRRRLGPRRRDRRAPAAEDSTSRSSTSRPASTSPIPTTGTTVGPVEVACLNAGVLGGAADPAEIALEGYRRTMARQRRRRRARRAPPRARDAAGRPDRRDRFARRPDGDAGRSGLRGHEARRRRLRPQRRPRSRGARHLDQRGLPRDRRHARCSAAPHASDRSRPTSRSSRPSEVADAVWLALESGADGARVGRPARQGADRLPLPERPRRPDGGGETRRAPLSD